MPLAISSAFDFTVNAFGDVWRLTMAVCYHAKFNLRYVTVFRYVSHLGVFGWEFSLGISASHFRFASSSRFSTRAGALVVLSVHVGACAAITTWVVVARHVIFTVGSVIVGRALARVVTVVNVRAYSFVLAGRTDARQGCLTTDSVIVFRACALEHGLILCACTSICTWFAVACAG